MLRLPLTLIVAAVACLSLAPQAPSEPPASQPAAAPSPALRVHGAGLKSLDLSLADLSALPRRTLAIAEKDGAVTKYEGVSIEDILTSAGMGFGQALRGPRLRDYLLVEAADGYAVVFALPELTTEFSDRQVIIADKVNGAAVSEKEGPLRVVVSDEKKHARWVRNVSALSIHTADAPPPPLTDH